MVMALVANKLHLDSNRDVKNKVSTKSSFYDII